MPYFAMIHWDDNNLSPVLSSHDGHGVSAALWDTIDEAKSAVEKIDVYDFFAITIHDTAGDE